MIVYIYILYMISLYIIYDIISNNVHKETFIVL